LVGQQYAQQLTRSGSAVPDWDSEGLRLGERAHPGTRPQAYPAYGEWMGSGCRSALARDERASAPAAGPGLVAVRATAVCADPTGAAPRVPQALLARSAVRRRDARGGAGAELVLHADAVPFHILEGEAAQTAVAAAAQAAAAVAGLEVRAGAPCAGAVRAASRGCTCRGV